MQQHHLVHRGQLVIFSVQMEQHDRLTLKKGNKIQQSSVISFKLPWLDWHTIFWLKATFQRMSAHIKNVGRISIQLREVLPPEALSLSNNTPVSVRLLFADDRATKRGNHLHSGGGQNLSIFLPSTKQYTIQWKTMPIVAPFEKFPFT